MSDFKWHFNFYYCRHILCNTLFFLLSIAQFFSCWDTPQQFLIIKISIYLLYIFLDLNTSNCIFYFEFQESLSNCSLWESCILRSYMYSDESHWKFSFRCLFFFILFSIFILWSKIFFKIYVNFSLIFYQCLCKARIV